MVLDADAYPYDLREVIALCRIGDDELAPLDPANRMATGLMSRCADLLAAAETLVVRGHPDACGVLLRAVIDSVVTAFWILDDPKQNLPPFLGEHLRSLRRMVKWSGKEEAIVEELAFYEQEFQSWGVEPVEEDMPHMNTRAASLWGDIRPLYKELSAELHASVRSVNLALSMRLSSDGVGNVPTCSLRRTG